MQLTIEQQDAVFTFGVGETILACKHTLRIPIANIQHVAVGEPQGRRFELRMPGAYVPGVIKAGTYIARGGAEFWYVSRSYAKRALIIDLVNSRYTRVVLGGPDIDHWLEQLTQMKLIVNGK